MPYTFSRKRAFRRTKRAAKFGYKHRGTIAKVVRAVAQIKREINVEHKIFNVASTAACSTTGTLVSLFQPAQGDTYQTREGVSTKPQSMTFRGILQLNPSSVITHVRIMIIKGKQENGVTPPLTDILDVATVQSQRNWLLRNKNIVMMDRCYSLTADTVGAASVIINKRFRLTGHTTFTSDSTTIENHGYYLIALSDQTVNTASLIYNIRTEFTDN